MNSVLKRLHRYAIFCLQFVITTTASHSYSLFCNRKPATIIVVVFNFLQVRFLNAAGTGTGCHCSLVIPGPRKKTIDRQAEMSYI